MPDLFWIGLVIALAGGFVGLLAGARSRTTRTATGLGIGIFMGLLAAFPLLAIGLSTA